MPSNEQRRQAAKRKLERQLARRAEQAKRRRFIAIGSAVLVVVLAVAGVFYFTNYAGEQPSASPAQPAPAPGAKPCSYTPTGEPAGV